MLRKRLNDRRTSWSLRIAIASPHAGARTSSRADDDDRDRGRGTEASRRRTFGRQGFESTESLLRDIERVKGVREYFSVDRRRAAGFLNVPHRAFTPDVGEPPHRQTCR